MFDPLYADAFRQDAAEVWDHIGAESPERADDVLDQVKETVALIAENPGIGRSREEIAPGVRSFLAAKRYLIYYKPLSDGRVVMLRLLHTSRDVEGRF